MAQIFGVCLLPATNEFVYDTVPARGARWNPTGGYFGAGALETEVPINCYYAPGGAKTDYSYALDQLQAAHPECQTVALVVAWFGNSTNASVCEIYPSTTYIEGAFQAWNGAAWLTQNWQCSGLDAEFGGPDPHHANQRLFRLRRNASDQSVVRCIRIYARVASGSSSIPFVLMDVRESLARTDRAFSQRLSSGATAAVNAFLGRPRLAIHARCDQSDGGLSGSPTDYTYRRMILHYANLCVIAGGVDLFLWFGASRPRNDARSRLDEGRHDGRRRKSHMGLPFVAGLMQFSADVRSIFDGAGLNKDLSGYKNLIAYSPDWSVWMESSIRAPTANGRTSIHCSLRPALIWSSFDNYLPLSDWTTGVGGLDCVNWTQAAPASWPPSTATMGGLGLSRFPTIYSEPYLAANIEGGEGFNWFYNNSNNDGRGLDPLGSGEMVSLPEGDRLTQSRNPFYANQQLLGRKQFRWWWNNTHQAIYDAGDGLGWAPHGSTTQWVGQSKPLIFVEYGFATIDKCTNQPNVFFSPGSSESYSPFWSDWNSADGENWLPQRDDLLANIALQTIYDYWTTGGHNTTSSGGVPFILTPFCCAWNYDARPFPT